MKVAIESDILFQFPNLYRTFAQSLLETGNDFFIFKIIKRGKPDKFLYQIQRLFIPYTAITIIMYDNKEYIAQIVLENCLEKHIELYIGQDSSFCKILGMRGIRLLVAQ